METVWAIWRLPVKGMVNRFKNDSIYSLCGSFSPFLTFLSFCWLFLALFLIHPMNLFSPHHALFACTSTSPSPVSSSPSLVFAPALLLSLAVSFSFRAYSFLTLYFFSFPHLYLLWFLPLFCRAFPPFELASHFLCWLPCTALSA